MSNQKNVTTAPAAPAVAAQPVEFSTEQKTQMVFHAAEAVKGELAREKALVYFAGCLGTNPGFDLFSASQANYQAGVLQVLPAISGDALQQSTTRFFSDLLHNYGMTRPTSGGAAAVKKTEQREKKKAEILSKHGDKTPAELNKEIKEQHKALADNPGDKAASKTLSELKAALTEITREENEAQRERIKKVKEDIRDAMKDASLTRLQAALKALRGEK